jgi:hypothetical protein
MMAPGTFSNLVMTANSVATANEETLVPKLPEEEREKRQQAARRHPRWIPDAEAPACMCCDAPFAPPSLRSRHHCRYCGWVVCDKCTHTLNGDFSSTWETTPVDRWVSSTRGHCLTELAPGGTKPKKLCFSCQQIAPVEVAERHRAALDPPEPTVVAYLQT